MIVPNITIGFIADPSKNICFEVRRKGGVMDYHVPALSTITHHHQNAWIR
jgi:hypothetical protein